MKYLMKVGDQLDLQVSYDGGAIDGVTYQAIGDVSVTSAGIVTALALGEGVINVLSGGDVVGSIVFEILTASEHAKRQAVRDGDKDLVIDAAAVAVAPAFTLVSTLSPWSAPSYSQSRWADKAFDGNMSTFYESDALFVNVVLAHLGAQFQTVKMIKKIIVKWGTAPTEIDVIKGNGEFLTDTITSFTVTPFANENTPSIQEIILPAYTASTALYIRPKTAAPVAGSYWANQGAATIDRFRVYEVEFYE